MRIIGGKHKRRRFDVPKSFNARPTTDFAKENLFNVLQYYIDFDEATALDLFSGTGSISAEHALFIRSVARELKEEARLQVLQSDVFRYLQASKGSRGQFDFIFADPPYKLKEIATLPQLILDSGLLKSDGVLVVEHPGTYDFSELPHFAEHREYGSVNFSIFALTSSQAEGEAEE